MNSLVQARVVVIDDDPKDATRLLASLGSMGIAAAYFDGSKESLPPKPLPGVRVVFLDFNLIGPLIEPKQYLPHAVQVLSSTVAFGRPNSVMIVAWTRHEETLDNLKSLLASASIVPAGIVAIENKFGLVDEGSIADVIAAVKKDFVDALQTRPGLHILLEWEHQVGRTAADVAELFHEWSQDNNHSDVVIALAVLATAVRGAAVPSSEESITAAMDGLNSVLTDRLLANSGAVPATCADALMSEMGQPALGKLNAKARASLNRVLLTCQMTGVSPRMGDVYIRDGDDVQWPLTLTSVQRAEFFKSLFGKALLKSDGSPTDQQIASHRAAARAWPALVEISPACDHQQGKLKNFRLLGGMLIPCDEVSDPDKALTLSLNCQMVSRDLPAFWLSAPVIKYDGPAKLVIDARWPQTTSISELEGWRPVCRLRPSVVADIQAMCAAHSARPGYVAIA